ncbi:beta-ketoacyl-[acyl-carrier-protein] synthase family protein [Gordonia sp. NB41Y]|uniref:beta-ketoacyl-[acyl-carrier-protein] synthase family protein n=1 Tax=Gordonia sp. NB41Y TaxID=875808 RepID=UPI00273B3116|nr:beta-ketoacyl-[acyl-carrier-protein] synthase family protein [Gordonia sp. NB41Y]WLP92935.1 beta-ketoacyl-[acyl-carrier-protein] synthase family protein [Gordonia sp. NB41Y]
MDVAITGQGVISSLGQSVPDFGQGLDNATITARTAPWADEAGGRVYYCPVTDFDPAQWLDDRTERGSDRFAQYAVAAAANAVEDAGIGDLDPMRTAVVIGTSMAGAETLFDAQSAYDDGGFEAIPKKVQMMAWPNMAAGHIALRWHLHGPLLTISTACASSLDAIGIATRMIQTGMADVAIAGGTDNGQVKLSSLSAVRYGMSPTDVDDPTAVCLPFDRHRRGVMGGDGAGAVILERLDHAQARGARIDGIVRGYGSLSDGYHPSSPDPSGRWEIAAMCTAQRDAGLDAREIGAVIAHGTGTPVGDAAEIIAINEVFGESVSATSIKGHVGHTAGAAGVMGVLTGLHTLRTNALPPTAGTTDLDPAIRFQVPLGAPGPVTLDAFQVNAFGFAGQNASLVIGRP